jgi:hypothetical protein
MNFSLDIFNLLEAIETCIHINTLTQLKNNQFYQMPLIL